MRPREDLLRADHGRRERKAPGIDMEHWNDRQHHIRLRKPDRVLQRQHQRVHHQRPMAVEHALGMSGRPGGVAEPGRVVLVDARRGKVRKLRFDQLLVVDGALRRRLAVSPDDDVARLHLRTDALPQSPQHVVDDHHRIVGVIDDVRDVLHGKPRVERVQHPAAERNREVGLQMAAVIPGEGGDALAGFHAQARERIGELLGAAVEVPIGAALDRLVRPARDDLGGGEVLARAIEEVHQRERILHHQSVHGASRPGSATLHP